MGKKSAPPPPPDYTALADKTAAAGAAANDMRTLENRPEQQDVYGNTSSWSQDPTTGQWTQKQSMGMLGQKALDTQAGMMGQASDLAGQKLDMSGLPSADLAKVRAGAGMFNMDPRGNSQEIQDATYKLLSPQREQSRESELQRLKNQGLTEDSPAFQRAMERLDQGDTDAQLKSLLAGTTEYGNQFNRGLQANNQNYTQVGNAEEFANALRGNQFQERIGEGQYNMGQLGEAAKLTEGFGPKFGSFVQANVDPTADYSAAGKNEYDAALAGNNAKNAGTAARTQGVISAVGTVAAIF